MANIGFASVSVIPSLKGFSSKVRAGIAAPLSLEGKNAGQKFGGFFSSSAAKVIAGVGLATGAVALGKKLVDAAVESQKVGKQTDAVLKSMGQQAHLTSAQVGDLATSISNKTGVDDEAIQSGENLLLTFGNVRNEVGKGNDIFTRATKLATDMSVALGQDLSSSNIQLGKALNDPIKGITALSRVGVSFTAQQKDQVTALVKSGKTLEAQKLILGEVERQFKGSAAAQATAGDRLKVVFGNLQEQLGGYLLPVVEKVAGFLADNLPRAMSATAKAAKPIVGAVKQVFGVLFQGDFKGGGPFAEDSPFIDNLFKLRDRVQAIMPKVIEAFQRVSDWVQKNWPKISKTISQVMDTVRSIIGGAVDVITVLWNNFGNNILELIQRIWPRIQQIIEGALRIIRSVIQTVTALIHGDWSGVWEGIKGIVTGAWEAIQGIVGGALEVLRSAIGIALEVIGSIFKSAWNGLKDIAAAGWQKLTDWVGGAVSGIGDVFSGLADLILWPFRTAFNAIASLWNHTVGALSFHIPGWVPGIGGKGFDVPDIPTWGGKGIPVPSRGDAISAGIIKMASGGIVKRRVGGIVANIGEGRYDEAVIPLRPGMDPLAASSSETAAGMQLSIAPGADRDAMGWILNYVRVNPAAARTLKQKLTAA